MWSLVKSIVIVIMMWLEKMGCWYYPMTLKIIILYIAVSGKKTTKFERFTELAFLSHCSNLQMVTWTPIKKGNRTACKVRKFLCVWGRFLCIFITTMHLRLCQVLPTRFLFLIDIWFLSLKFLFFKYNLITWHWFLIDSFHMSLLWQSQWLTLSSIYASTMKEERSADCFPQQGAPI